MSGFRGVIIEWEDGVLRPPSHPPAIDDIGRATYAELSSGCSVHDDARALLPSLRYRGYRCAVMSLGPFDPEAIEHHARELGLSGYIDTVASSAATTTPTALLRAACTGLRTSPDALVVAATSMALQAAALELGTGAAGLLRRGRKTSAGTWQSLAHVNQILGEAFRPATSL